MGRLPANFRQQDVTKAINAAKRAGLELVRVEVDPKTGRIALIVKEGDETKTIRSSADLPIPPMRAYTRRAK